MSYHRWTDPFDAQNACTISSVSDYDDAGRVTRTRQLVSDASGSIAASERTLSQAFYNSLGNVDYTLDENGLMTVYDYDETGSVVQTAAYQPVEVPDPQNPPQTMIVYEPLTVSRTLYDAEGRPVISVGPYDPTDAAADRTGTQTVYDALGRVEITRRWADVDILLEDITHNGQIVGKKAVAWTTQGAAPVPGQEMSYTRTEYDIAGRTWRTYTQTEAGDEVCTHEYHYDPAGRQTLLVTLPDDTSGKRSESATEYDGSYRDTVTDGLDHTTGFKYDAMGRVTTTIHPASILSSGTEPVITYSHAGYDTKGRKIWESVQTIHADTPEDPVPDTEIKTYEYDSVGRLVAVVLPPVADPQDGDADRWSRTEYEYDLYGNLNLIRTKVRQMKSPFDAAFDLAVDLDYTDASETTITFDHMHRQTSRTVPGLGTEYATYDPETGRLQKETDFKGQVTLYYYYTQTTGIDAGGFYGMPGQLLCKDYYATDPCPNPSDPLPDPDTVHPLRKERIAVTYDRLGRKRTEVMYAFDETGAVTSEDPWEYEYDPHGNLAAVASPQGTLHYVYSDITGRKTYTYTGPSLAEVDTLVKYEYDQLGRLASVRLMKRNGEEVTPTEQTQYTYDLVGNRRSVTLPNGVYTEYTCNALNRLTGLVHYRTEAKADTLSAFHYGLNAQGMRTHVTELLDESRHLAYAYDHQNRLIREDSYDAATLNPALDDGYTTQYEYDLIGNCLGRQVNVHRNSESPAVSEVLSTEYMEYDTGDRLLKERNLDTAIFTALPWDTASRAYAYADGQGGFGYRLSGSESRLGQFAAFWIGLPSAWNRWLFVLLLVLIPLAFFWPLLRHWYLGWTVPTRDNDSLNAPGLKLWHRCLCVLLAYIFLVGPQAFQILAHADIQYGQMTTQAWGHAGDVTTYFYDENGSQTYKVYANVDTGADPADILDAHPGIEYDKLDYNLQNRLYRFAEYRVEASDTIETVTEYRYNPDGIRVASYTCKTVNTGSPQDKTAADYLIDPANHTGYAQVLEETAYEYSAGSWDPIKRIQYTIGDDIISQTRSTWSTGGWTAEDLDTDGEDDTEYLLYDGHGSTRQLVRPDKTLVSSYSYDGYGIMLGGNPTMESPAATSLLYTGEQFDPAVQSYYLRARYYTPHNGRFNRMDDFAGDMQDPQSLHKYLYCHANPINNIDPTGLFSMIEVITVTTITMSLFSTMLPIAGGIYAAVKAGISPGEYISELFSSNTWREALIAVGLGSVIGMVIKQIAKKVAVSLLCILGLLMSMYAAIQSIGLTRNMVNGNMNQKNIAHFLAFSTAVIILGVLIGSIVSKGASKPSVNNAPEEPGIYEFQSSSGRIYVGQSKHLHTRINQHLKSGKLKTSDLKTLKWKRMPGSSKTDREIAEQLRINQYGLDNLENVRNALSPKRQSYFGI